MDNAPFGSPIEIELAAGIVEHGGMQFVPKFGLPYEEIRNEAAKAIGRRDQARLKKAVVFPQVKIAKYVVDFLALFWDDRDFIMPIAVECDGHDFHERTPRQAQYDKLRDRFFATNSIFVMRFTGREIKRDPVDCARQVYRATEFTARGPSASLVGVQWILSEAELDVLLEAQEHEAEQEYFREQQIEDFKRKLSIDEIMSGTYEGLYP
jgi:very-short-patch-repair endonuclease